MTDFNPNDINAVLARMEERQIDNCRKLDSSLDRIATLEKFQWRMAGGLTVLLAVVEFFKH